MRRADGTAALVAVLLIVLMLRVSRGVFPLGEDPPVFFAPRPGHVAVHLGAGFPESGFHHFFDGACVSDVIGMAGLVLVDEKLTDASPMLPLRDGESLDIVVKNNQVIEIQRNFIQAAQRVTLGIALHPDTLEAPGWQALPGIGPVLANRIEKNRQKNGDFGDFHALQRVRGIGPVTMERIRPFFETGR